MAQQTAIEWLEQQLKSTYDNEGKLPLAYTLDLVKQAKQMEKEQIRDAFDSGRNAPDNYVGYGMQYFYETYEK